MPIASAAVLVPLLGSGCTLVQPGCRNRDVMAAIEHEARDAVDLGMSISGQSAPSAETPINLVDQVEVGRHDNTRSCTARVLVGGGGDAAAVPIDYEVIAGDGGQPFYRWDQDGFEKQVIGTAFISALSNIAHSQKESSPADHPPPQPTVQPPTIMEAWTREVHGTISARAEALTGMPAGTQRVRFRIGPDGEITMARAVEPIENAQLAERIVNFLDTTDRVAKPPFDKATWVEVVMSF